MPQRGTWFDGQVAIERDVEVVREDADLVLTDAHGTESRVATADLVKLDESGGQIRLGYRSNEGWRLILSPPVQPAILDGLPKRRGSVAPTASRRTIGILAGGLSVLSAAAALVIFAPQTVAQFMPMSWERKIGAIYDLPVGMARCEEPRAQASLDQILDRLDPRARKDGFVIQLIDFDEANAVALPGGRIVVFNGLFEDIEDADAVAGIVAHEIAHVHRRHVAAGMVRELGLGTVVTLLGGGAIASNASGLLSLKFSRTAEAQADADAVQMLKRADIDPRPTAQAFQQFRKREGDWPEWLASHPASGGRGALFSASYEPRRSYRHVLGSGEAKALLDACQS